MLCFEKNMWSVKCWYTEERWRSISRQSVAQGEPKSEYHVLVLSVGLIQIMGDRSDIHLRRGSLYSTAVYHFFDYIVSG